MNRQQAFIKFYNGLSLKRQLQIKKESFEDKDLPFSKENWGLFLSQRWVVPEQIISELWSLVDRTYENTGN